MSEPISLTAGALLETLTARIAVLLRRRHEDAAEQTALEEQARLLRIGLSTPEAVLLALQTRGVRLRGITMRPSAERRRVAGG